MSDAARNHAPSTVTTTPQAQHLPQETKIRRPPSPDRPIPGSWVEHDAPQPPSLPQVKPYHVLGRKITSSNWNLLPKAPEGTAPTVDEINAILGFIITTQAESSTARAMIIIIIEVSSLPACRRPREGDKKDPMVMI
ncbi:hypothetical protein LZ554_001539 [Drepanopeziza brunnea f. sp. 'monogermtubi']|nr:hypothetical protein LZ554_001539 [Drepanopeziza brunnea f. sp. 'monogermtubi']